MKSHFKTTLLSSLVLSALATSPLTYAAPSSLLAPYAQRVDSVIVKYKNVNLGTAFTAQGTRNAQAAVDSLTARSGERLEFRRRMYSGAQVIGLGQSRRVGSAEALAQRLLASDPNIEYAEANRRFHTAFAPNDPMYRDQWSYFEPVGGINGPAAWDITGGAGVTVAVVDTGYRPHADLTANILGGADFVTDSWAAVDGNGRDSDATDPGDGFLKADCDLPDDHPNSWHGTHVAGTIAAVSNNRLGVAGVAPQARVVPVRVLGKCGGELADIADGLAWAAGVSVAGMANNANPARVINASLSGKGACPYSYQRAIDAGRAKGAVYVFAAGNDNGNANDYAPGNCRNTLTIAATGRTGARAAYSNTSSSVALAAPGGDMSRSFYDGILSSVNSGQSNIGRDDYAYMEGTSMASPHVAGVAALVISANPKLSGAEVETILKQTARRFPSSCNGCGTGIVDAFAAVTRAKEMAGGKPVPNPGTPPVTPPPVNNPPRPIEFGALINGKELTGIELAKGQEAFYTLTVPAKSVDMFIGTTGGSGDVSLYVKIGSRPTDSSYDCLSKKTGNQEWCEITGAAPAGTHQIRLKAETAVSGMKMKATFTVK